MESRTYSSDLLEHVGNKVFVRGWLHASRLLGSLCFLIVRDKKGLFQVVIQDKEDYRKIASLQPGSILNIKGEVSKSKSREFDFELINPEIEIENPITVAPPLDYSKPEITASLEFILDNRSVSFRNPKISAVFQIQAQLAHAYRLFMNDVAGATEYFPPCMVSESAEGGAEFFTVNYFETTASLAQSSQLYKQIMVGAFEKAFAIASFFRAEPSHTPRHLAEGHQLEFEMGFFNSWHDIMQHLEDAMRYVLRYLEKRCARELAVLGVNLPKGAKIFPRITFKDAQQIYFERTGVDERNENDLSPAAEKELCAYALEKFDSDFVFITHWKREKRPFYSYPNEDDSSLTNTFDLLSKGVEISSGGQRRHTYESVVEGIKEKGLKPEDFESYLQTFACGMPPHGGFGVGLERLTASWLGLKNIREASLFPSDTIRIASERIKRKVFIGGQNIRDEILRLLKHNSLVFKHLTHKETLTSEESAKERGTELSEGVKSIILKGKSSLKNYLVNIPANAKLDMKAIATKLDERCEFEDPEVIQTKFGLKVGSVPPFGNLLNIEKTLFDEGILTNKRSAFNCGLTTESIIMSTEDLIRLVKPEIGSFAKEG